MAVAVCLVCVLCRGSELIFPSRVRATVASIVLILLSYSTLPTFPLFSKVLWFPTCISYLRYVSVYVCDVHELCEVHRCCILGLEGTFLLIYWGCGLQWGEEGLPDPTHLAVSVTTSVLLRAWAVSLMTQFMQ